jgi:E3 ubiquitin-protein ligase BAH
MQIASSLSTQNNSYDTVEIPLTSDSEFFQTLKWELGDLNQLQQTEQTQLTIQITKLGNDITSLTSASRRRSRAELGAWREIFRLYIEHEIFFSTSEQTAGSRTSTAAQQKLTEYIQHLTLGPKNNKQLRLSRPDRHALTTFLHINTSLLHFMKFQELNRTALSKILKKFDKRTALHAAQASLLPRLLLHERFLAHDLAKAACFTIQEHLLPVVPQLSDYLCSICLGISFKPVRLRCSHVFCIRCLIVMQRAGQDRCPLCRSNVVVEATVDNLDMKLMAFLQAKFPAEVEAKQTENQRAAGVDKYGEDFDKCVVM